MPTWTIWPFKELHYERRLQETLQSVHSIHNRQALTTEDTKVPVCTLRRIWQGAKNLEIRIKFASRQHRQISELLQYSSSDS